MYSKLPSGFSTNSEPTSITPRRLYRPARSAAGARLTTSTNNPIDRFIRSSSFNNAENRTEIDHLVRNWNHDASLRRPPTHLDRDWILAIRQVRHHNIDLEFAHRDKASEFYDRGGRPDRDGH